MKLALRWLRDFVDLPEDDPDELARIIAMLGHEVEGIDQLDIGWTDVVVGKVVDIAPHPDADRVRVCQVDIGNETSQIICGAWNFDVGDHVAVALPGAVLPGDFKIAIREIRGVASHGMICSESELGLGDDHEGILVLDGEPEVGKPFSDLVELPDVVFDLSITPNRPDAMSVLGVARDLAAFYGVDFRLPEVPDYPTTDSAVIDVEIGDVAGCRRFTAHQIDEVRVGRSPLRIRHRLLKAGMRPISNVVDVTNYVMLELGHPLHAFDTDSIVGSCLKIERADAGQTLETLDGVTRRLDVEDLIIYDAAGPTSMSGTMGGMRSEVSSSTTSVLMEAASWDPPTIMFMSRRHGLRSEASARFERGVDPNLALLANARATAMVAELTGGKPTGEVIDVIGTPSPPLDVSLHLDSVSRLLGPEFPVDHAARILESIGFEVAGEDPLLVTVPTFRPDVTRPVDLVEELARIHGYDKFDETLPVGAAGGLTHEQRRTRKLFRSLVGVGFSQAVTLPFVNPEDLKMLGAQEGDIVDVANPLSEEESHLRTSLLPNLLRSLQYNHSHGSNSVALFESGTVFLGQPDEVDPRLPSQTTRLAWVVSGAFGPIRLGSVTPLVDAAVSVGVFKSVAHSLGTDDITIQNAKVEGFHPGRAAELVLGSEVVGVLGELSPRTAEHFGLEGRVAVAEIDQEALVAVRPLHQLVVPSTYPHVDFDLSFVVPDSVAASTIRAKTVAAGGNLVESCRVFDEFAGASLGEGNRAVALRYRLRSSSGTLSGDEVDPIRKRMIEAAREVGAVLRGS